MVEPTSVLPAEFKPVARYHVVHETKYTYQSAVTLSQQYLHLSPLNFRYQQVLSQHIAIVPAVADSVDGQDYFGNATRHFSITVPHQVLIVQSEFTVELAPRVRLDKLKESLPWELMRDTLLQSKARATQLACQFLYASPHVSCSTQLQQYALASFTPVVPNSRPPWI